MLIQRLVYKCSQQLLGNSLELDTTQMSINRQVSKQILVHPYNRLHAAIKRKEVLKHKTTWLNVMVIILNEINQTLQKRIYCLIPFI